MYTHSPVTFTQHSRDRGAAWAWGEGRGRVINIGTAWVIPYLQTPYLWEGSKHFPPTTWDPPASWGPGPGSPRPGQGSSASPAPASPSQAVSLSWDPILKFYKLTPGQELASTGKGLCHLELSKVEM